jgi:hypothetical protein
MIDRDHELPVSKQCAALGISRGSVYYEPAAVSAMSAPVWFCIRTTGHKLLRRALCCRSHA